jgi:hypothetical protein
MFALEAFQGTGLDIPWAGKDCMSMNVSSLYGTARQMHISLEKLAQ